MELPVDLTDRVAELENAVDELQRLLAATRDRRAESTTPRGVRLVRTAERSDGFPLWDGQIELPVQFLDLEPNGAVTAFTRSTRALWPRAIVRSQWGWLPPDVEMMVAPGLDDRYVFACRPPMLHGKLWVPGYYGYESEFSAASNGSDCLSVGPAERLVALWRKTGSGTYEPQEYADGSPVIMQWHNVGDAIAADILMSAVINADNQWIATPETCDPCIESA